MEGLTRGIPKAELHLHLEGTLEPELLLELAARHRLRLPYRTAADVRAARRFTDLPSFLRVYYEGVTVLRDEEDFRRLALAYLERVQGDGVRHAEMFFDPQSHLTRGVSLEAAVEGIGAALVEAEERFGMTSRLIMCFLRDRGPDEAAAVLAEALRFKDWIAGVGLDSAEAGYRPGVFAGVFERARDEGLAVVAHAGEEGPAAYVREALDELLVSRVDHGVHAADDPALLERLKAERIPLTMCPLSNLRLGVVPSLEEHPLKKLLRAGLLVTVNSDDPAYFGGYIAENWQAIREAQGLTRRDLVRLAVNSFEASLLDEEEKRLRLAEVAAYAARRDIAA